ncbi:MAG: hypothetical protein WBP11_05225 [Dokdonella sp.]
MPTAAHPSIVAMAGIALLIAWRLYARIRRMVGRQQFSRRRPLLAVIFFPLLLTFLAVMSFAHPQSLAALTGGAALGIGLGWYGLKLTTFETTPTDLYYTPNAHLGVALSVLLIVRVGYRLLHGMVMTAQDNPLPSDFARSPLTLAIFGTLAAYYVFYAAGLLRWHRAVEREKIACKTVG